ncbi:hypothetical protein [Sporosarcina newyorkensis]|nr:hypothetical protein [Sporosarcina newyorkensis]
MEERILQLLEGLTDDVKIINSDVSGLQEQVGKLETKTIDIFEQVDQRFNLMEQHFDRFEHLLQGIGEQFDYQTKFQIKKEDIAAKKLTVNKSKVFDVGSKT